jgi:hypothetical protein
MQTSMVEETSLCPTPPGNAQADGFLFEKSWSDRYVTADDAGNEDCQYTG